MRISYLFMAMVFLATLGMGCDFSSLPYASRIFPTATSTIDFGADSLSAARAVQFLPGDTFEIRQTVLGFGSFIPDLLGNKDGVRFVTISRFAPMNFANLDWKVESKQESAYSVKARELYERQLEENPQGIGEGVKAPPIPQMEDVTVSGTVMNINLKTPHSTYLPVYWGAGLNDLMNEKSGIWLTEDAFNELVRTRRTILNLGVFDSDANQAAKNVSELKTALDKLRKQADEDGKFKDLTLLEAESDFVDYVLKINGRRVTVSAIKAKNWFGEVIVLNNPQNPLILKVTMNPISSSASDALGGSFSFVDKFYGYEISNIELTR